MKEVNRIINESGISKVKIAKYLGVSRQMLYNYLSLKSFNDLPKEKQNKLLSLFKVSDSNELASVKVDDAFIEGLENDINAVMLGSINKESIANLFPSWIQLIYLLFVLASKESPTFMVRLV